MPPEFMSRRDAGAYLKGKYGFSSKKTLDKLATVGGGPEYHKAGPAPSRRHLFDGRTRSIRAREARPASNFDR